MSAKRTLTLISGIVVAAAIAWMSAPRDSVDRAKTLCAQEAAEIAFYAGRTLVANEVAGQASFPDYGAPETGVAYLGDCTFHVLGYADVTDGAGVTRRRAYEGDIRLLVSSMRWESVSLRLR